MPADKIHFLPEATFRQQVLRLYYTLRPLRWQQYFFRIWHPLKRLFYIPREAASASLQNALMHPRQDLFRLPVFDQWLPRQQAFFIHNIYSGYDPTPAWDDTKYGMLRAYHMHYFGWLRDPSVTTQTHLELMRSYATAANNRIGWDSYPVSLRAVAWIRFFLQHDIKDALLLRKLFRDCHRLYHFPEYAIQGNHLWENGCALTIAGAYFGHAPFYQKGLRIFCGALEEQVLQDGGHIEGSPMYHSLLLSGLLQCIELLAGFDKKELLPLFKKKAVLMLGWLRAVQFKDGSLPRVNDATGGVAPDPETLYAFAARLQLFPATAPLSDSGYRKLAAGPWELFIDAAQVMPAWQPGHSHADTLSFCLQAGNRPLIVDRGISVYTPGPKRREERSTSAHNTLHLPNINSSDVWKGFRVGRRAKVDILDETSYRLIATHDGYKGQNIIHKRIFKIFEKYINIEDNISDGNTAPLVLNLHFHPDVQLEQLDTFTLRAGTIKLSIIGAQSTIIEPYDYAMEFNRTISAYRLRIVALTSINITIEDKHAD